MGGYAATLERLFALRRFGVRPGLDVIAGACARLGHPERAFSAIQPLAARTWRWQAG